MESIDDIIKECRKNKRKAQKRLYDLFSAKMYGVCMRYAKNHHDAQDILQDGFLIVFEKIHTYNYEGSFEGWIKRIMINEALQKYRNKISHLDIDRMENNVEYNINTIDFGKYHFNELIEIIHSLPTQYRIVFNMYAIEGYSHKEIAAALNISDTTSRTNYLRARSILKDKLCEDENVAEYYKIALK